MSQELWNAVDDYYAGLLLENDPVLQQALEASDAAGLPQIGVSAAQGKFLQLLAVIQQATKILELGTLGGYSTIWLARALPAGGRLTTLEYNPRCAEVARANIERAGLAHLVEIRVGKALDTLPELHQQQAGPFDLVFIDADKANTAAYFTWALQLSRPGSVIVTDNVVREGAIIDAANDDPGVQGVRAFNELVAREPRVASTVLQTVSPKGYDGFMLSRVVG